MRVKESSTSLKLRNASAKHNNSGVVFIGSPLDSFHMIIRCPVHVYTCIKKSINLMNNPPHLMFCSGSIPISDLALPQFRGTFLYKSPTGKKQKFNAAFIFPTCCNDEDFSSAFSLLNCFNFVEYDYFSESNKSLKTILSEICPSDSLFASSDFQDFVLAFSGDSSTSFK